MSGESEPIRSEVPQMYFEGNFLKFIIVVDISSCVLFCYEISADKVVVSLFFVFCFYTFISVFVTL